VLDLLDFLSHCDFLLFLFLFLSSFLFSFSFVISWQTSRQIGEGLTVTPPPCS